jgi:hypothetical protein
LHDGAGQVKIERIAVNLRALLRANSIMADIHAATC